MYCESCGIDAVGQCPNCGKFLLPASETTSEQPQTPREESPWLWNPDVAALLSWILFTSLFGALVHAANWKRLGERRRMWGSLGWALISILSFLAVSVFVAVTGDAGSIHKLLVLTFFLNVVAWYFISGRAQSKYIIAKYTKHYRRESWVIPVALALVVLFFLNLA